MLFFAPIRIGKTKTTIYQSPLSLFKSNTEPEIRGANSTNPYHFHIFVSFQIEWKKGDLRVCRCVRCYELGGLGTRTHLFSDCAGGLVLQNEKRVENGFNTCK